MKPLLTVLAFFAWMVPAVGHAQAADRIQVDSYSLWYAGLLADQALATSASDAPFVGKMKPIQVGEVVVRRGPRGRARTFVYRGRNVTVIRRPHYVYPRGFRYRRWHAGQLLPAALIAAPFFFLEYEELGLQRPPPGYRWVRYGPDVVLVNMRTREVEDVAYGAIDDED